MRTMTCIVCPRGCRLEVGDASDGFPVSGNGCPRGERYARDEMTIPTRTVTATVRCVPAPRPDNAQQPDNAQRPDNAQQPDNAQRPETADDSLPRRAPVRTAGRVPKDLALPLARELAAMTVTLPVRAGDVLMDDWRGTGVAIVFTRDVG